MISVRKCKDCICPIISCTIITKKNFAIFCLQFKKKSYFYLIKKEINKINYILCISFNVQKLKQTRNYVSRFRVNCFTENERTCIVYNTQKRAPAPSRQKALCPSCKTNRSFHLPIKIIPISTTDIRDGCSILRHARASLHPRIIASVGGKRMRT